MPTYGYQCKECKHEFSVFQSMKDDPIASCPTCSGSVKRLLYPVGIVFKGTGWYVNDSRKPDVSESAGAPADSKDGEAKGAEAKTDAKTDAKADAGSDGKSSTGSETKTEAKAPEAAASK